MEFDGNDKGNTNFEQWGKTFAEMGLSLPHIVFWNASETTSGFPVVKDTKNVTMISGSNPVIAERLFNSETLSPETFMFEVLDTYTDKYLK